MVRLARRVCLVTDQAGLHLREALKDVEAPAKRHGGEPPRDTRRERVQCGWFLQRSHGNGTRSRVGVECGVVGGRFVRCGSARSVLSGVRARSVPGSVWQRRGGMPFERRAVRLREIRQDLNDQLKHFLRTAGRAGAPGRWDIWVPRAFVAEGGGALVRSTTEQGSARTSSCGSSYGASGAKMRRTSTKQHAVRRRTSCTDIERNKSIVGTHVARTLRPGTRATAL